MRGEAPQYYVENGHPAIVSKAVWAEAQERLAAIPENSQTSDPFFGKIHCGDCGGLYGRRIWHSTTTHDVVWECYNRKTGKTRCRCSHVYDSELQHAVSVVLQRLLNRYPDITQYCCRYSTDTLHTGSNALHICEDHRSNILPGGPVFDDTAVRFLIKEIKITSGGTAMFHFLDGSRLRYPLSAATPKGRPGMAEKRRNHQRIMELHSSGMGATEIARTLGISVNTVRSYLKRHSLAGE